jgi:hypothetical protein
VAYSKQQVQAVLKSILKPEQIESLGTPRAIEEAAVKLFMEDEMYNSQECVDILREALCDLRDSGSLNYKPASKE